LEDKQRKQKVEIEARRKTEAELAKKLEKENEKNQAEQEKLDYDLAIRLAPEINGEVEPMNAVKK
jgi:gamma-glutamyl phosphate reductase